MADVVMPQFGPNAAEGTLMKWLKKPGERVRRGDPLFKVSTDEITAEVLALVSGILTATLIEEGKTVAINTVVARIDESSGAESVLNGRKL